jgi:UPF0042 nucleotide-binding protein
MTRTAEKAAGLHAGAQTPLHVLVVTGMSGAGKSTALKALEDLGYEAVDNLPLSMVTGLVRPSLGIRRPLAVGVDIRTRDFGVAPFLHEIDELISSRDCVVRVLFLECSDEVLRRRYTETRRRHPLALDRPVTDGIRHERRLVTPLRSRADVVIDTSTLNLHDLKRILGGHFSLESPRGLAVFVVSFAYRNGLPPEADIVIDVRFLTNPHYEPQLRGLSGLDQEVVGFVEADPGFASFFKSLTDMLQPLFPRFSQEGKSYLTIAVGCTGGQHRSVVVAERLASWIRETGERVSVAHRELTVDRGVGRTAAS